MEKNSRTSTLFGIGRLAATAAVNARAKERPAFAAWMLLCLKRHLSGDWGDVSKPDMEANDRAVLNGNERILSSYTNTKGLKLAIITEANRGATTILFPDEY